MYRSYYGYSLIEVMIVVAVVAILASIAYPSYQQHMIKNRRTDGKIALLEIMQAQREYYLNNKTFTTDLVNDLDWPNDSGQVFSENRFYEIEADACQDGSPLTDCVRLSADPQGGQQGDGSLSYNSRNVKTPLNKWN